MANPEQLRRLKQGSTDWNEWKAQHPEIRPDLSGAHLSGAHLSGAHLSGAILSGAHLNYAILNYAILSRALLFGAHLYEADLSGADLSGADLSKANLNYAILSKAHLSGTILSGANLSRADLSGANLSRADLSRADLSFAYLSGANLSRADLSRADLSGAHLGGAILSFANLSGANLSGANLSRADLSRADLSRADLSRAILVRTNLAKTTLKDCSIYGIAVWDVRHDGAEQLNLRITPDGQPAITVDNLEVAQFIYLLLNNPKIREVIDTVAKQAVLILGRFTPSRKPILEAIRTALRSKNYLPILFDFEPLRSQDVTETVDALAHLSRFIIADLSDPSCSPYEVGLIAPNHIKPLQPIFQPTGTTHHEFAMLKDLQKRHYWVLPTYHYSSLEDLIASLTDKIIAPAEQKLDEIALRRKEE